MTCVRRASSAAASRMARDDVLVALVALVHGGGTETGDLLLGGEAVQAALAALDAPPDRVAARDRPQQYPQRARAALAGEDVVRPARWRGGRTALGRPAGVRTPRAGNPARRRRGRSEQRVAADTHAYLPGSDALRPQRRCAGAARFCFAAVAFGCVYG
ncbi:hypothetical protein G6F60_013911 [Rhizopus arrhizus]|nr:hypothetical protein G6F60_013911 [Rhizopus arrhizus]